MCFHACSTLHASAAVNRDTRRMKVAWRTNRGSAAHERKDGAVTRLLRRARTSVPLKALRHPNNPRHLGRCTCRISKSGTAVRNIWRVHVRVRLVPGSRPASYRAGSGARPRQADEAGVISQIRTSRALNSGKRVYRQESDFRNASASRGGRQRGNRVIYTELGDLDPRVRT